MNKLSTSKSKKFNWVFLFGLLFFSSFYVDIWHTPNPVSRALPVLTTYETGTLEITQYEKVGLDKSKVGDKYYSDKAPLPTLLTIPFYEALAALGWDSWEYEDKRYKGAPVWYLRLSLIIFIGSLICSSLPFVLLIWFAFRFSGDFKYKSSLIILSFFGTYLFVYSGTYFNHLLSGASLAFATYFIQKPKYSWLSGLMCAMAFLSEYTLGLYAALLPLFLLFKENRWRLILQFGLGFLPAILIYAWYNYSLTGNPLTFIFYYTDFETFSKGIKQNYGFGLPSFESFYGLLLSPYMGILWFFPVLFFFLNKWRKDKWKELLSNPVFVNSLAMFILISCYFIWWGGYSWGPRYLIPMACILAFHSPRIWQKFQYPKVALLVLSISFLLQFAAKSTVLFLIPDRFSEQGEASYPFSEVVLKAMKEGNFNSNNLFSWWFDLNPMWSAVLFLILFTGWLVGLEKLYHPQKGD
ncbi:MAG: hypothetical protein RIC95_01765 [Vicingaceae bacterium]